MRTIAYARVSTIGQAKDGLGIPTQERLIRGWAKKSSHKLVRILTDNGRSGMLAETERPGLLEALSAIRRGEAQALVVTSIDRLARALTVQEAVLGKVWAMGAVVYTVDGGEVPQDDPDDPVRTAMRQMAGVFAQLERAMVVKRLRNGRTTKAAQGGYAGGRPAFGYKAEGGKLVENPAEQKAIELARRLHRKGTSLRTIAAELTAAGHPARSGSWHPTAIARLLR